MANSKLGMYFMNSVMVSFGLGACTVKLATNTGGTHQIAITIALAILFLINVANFVTEADNYN